MYPVPVVMFRTQHWTFKDHLQMKTKR